MSLADLLRTKREANGLTQEYIAEKTGVSTVTVSGWENGTRPKDNKIPKIIEAYKITPEEYGREYMSTVMRLAIKKKCVSRQKFFPYMLFTDKDAEYLKNLNFTSEEVILIRNICIAQTDNRYWEWTLGCQYAYNPSVLSLLRIEENSGASQLNRIAHGLWEKFNCGYTREPHKNVIAHIIQYLMEDPKGIESDTFDITDLCLKDFMWIAWALLHTANRACEYNTAWVPQFESLIQIVQCIEQNEFNPVQFVRDNHLLYNKSLKPEYWLLSGRITREWISYENADPEFSFTEENDNSVSLTDKGRALAAYVAQNKKLFQTI